MKIIETLNDAQTEIYKAMMLKVRACEKSYQECLKLRKENKNWILRAKLAINALINDRKNLELIKKQNEKIIKNQERITLLLKTFHFKKGNENGNEKIIDKVLGLLAGGGRACEHDGNIIIEKGGTRYQTGENMKIKTGRDYKGG